MKFDPMKPARRRRGGACGRQFTYNHRVKLLILGVTGPTGQQLVTRALETGHEVAALVRDRAKITAPIEVIRGDATDAAAIDGASRGRDAVLSALGTGKSFRGD